MTMNSPDKPKIIVNLGYTPAPALRAAASLRQLHDNASHHEALDRRHPLGIYNVSTSRILKKLRTCCENLEAHHHAAATTKELAARGSLADDVIDYLELTLYAAAEHVDDIETIAECFFSDKDAYHRSPDVKRLKTAIRPIRARISGFTNAIKHHHCRIRLFSCDFHQQANVVCLHGFLIEQFHNGRVGPSPLFHADGERIISITSFLWSVLFYLYSMAEALHHFLVSIRVVTSSPTTEEATPLLTETLIGLLRLPLYSFDDVHPFEVTRLIVSTDDKHRALLASNIYGSISRPWSKSLQGGVGSVSLTYEGDGTSRSFDMSGPRNIRLQHWN
jgi:hypothetical protein